MNSRHGEGRKHPNLAVVDEQVGAGVPALLVAVVGFEAQDVGAGEAVGALLEGGHFGVVQRHEAGAPLQPMQRVTVLVEADRREARPDNAFPGAHACRKRGRVARAADGSQPGGKARLSRPPSASVPALKMRVEL